LQAKFEKLIEGAMANAPPGIVPYIQKITPCLSWTVVWCAAARVFPFACFARGSLNG
jgi:hypothetical protein